jgi:putative Ca2+/H+ antiporter (TMEM165/GDT1 family)
MSTSVRSPVDSLLVAAGRRPRVLPSPDGSLLAAFGVVFVAELGDKTMLATATLAAQGNPVLTWFGATAGIICAGALGVFAGRAFGARLSERTTRIGAAVLFAGFGLVLIATNL